MNRTAGTLSYVASALVGAIVGAIIVLGVDGLTRTSEPRPARTPAPPTHDVSEPLDVAAETKVLLAWVPGGLPARTERVLERTRGVGEIGTVAAGLDWITRSRGPNGAIVDAPRESFAIPFEVAVIDPAEYAAFVPPGDREQILSLRRGEMLLAQTEATLRGAAEGLQIELSSGTRRVSGVVSDLAANGYEGLTRGPVPTSWERVDRFVLAQLNRPVEAAVERRVRRLLEPGQVVRVRSKAGSGENPFLRYGDAVLPQLLIKKSFGEFAARPMPDGSIQVDPAWKDKNIVAADVPILGRVTCHRAIVPQLRRALEDVASNGLAFSIDPSDFGGCYSPRFINADPEGRLSHHSWGIAFDLNVSENRFGTKPDLDPRLVDVLEGWGFTWGGRWLIPDGMHFEWVRFP